MPLPTLTPAQRAAALEKAAQTRTARAQARAQLRSGELSPLDVLRAPTCLLYTSPSPRDRTRSRMPSSA